MYICEDLKSMVGLVIVVFGGGAATATESSMVYVRFCKTSILDFKLSTHAYLPVKMEQTDCSETSAYKLQTPGNYPKENIKQRQVLL
jgi:hypothetical protein